jgi:hypothetical protein
VAKCDYIAACSQQAFNISLPANSAAVVELFGCDQVGLALGLGGVGATPKGDLRFCDGYGYAWHHGFDLGGLVITSAIYIVDDDTVWRSLGYIADTEATGHDVIHAEKLHSRVVGSEVNHADFAVRLAELGAANAGDVAQDVEAVGCAVNHGDHSMILA